MPKLSKIMQTHHKEKKQIHHKSHKKLKEKKKNSRKTQKWWQRFTLWKNRYKITSKDQTDAKVIKKKPELHQKDGKGSQSPKISKGNIKRYHKKQM